MIRILLILLALGFLAGSPQLLQAQKLKTPYKTFSLLRKAIKKEDLGLYKKLWAEERMEQEGMVSKLENDPEKWKELQAIFAGRQTLENTSTLRREEGTYFKAHVHAPQAEGGGIGSISFKKIGNDWKLWSW